ncbi:E3 ubiquitin-protein ligase RNF144A isoform X4 [Panthera onca]|nr:E3 ubiquitin-protein ligase RNF144A isoform X1 [Panthera tigris]XP_042838491.1 E3 ubiquitin-protein ligase RNF144A isoform X1 [Panthera tigris]XP_049508546.1 E3 ubiquitin-protein ligase RNF144A isoform X1 [Panthera uncia]
MTTCSRDSDRGEGGERRDPHKRAAPSPAGGRLRTATRARVHMRLPSFSALSAPVSTPPAPQCLLCATPAALNKPLLQSPPASETGPLQQSSRPPTPSCPGGTHQSAAAAHSCDASGTDCSAMTTARYRPTWDLALDPLVSCKLCLGEYPVEQMTTIAQCQCIFCTLCLKQYVELLIKEGLETAISCPDAACPKQGHLQEDEIECMVAAEIMQRYKKLQFEREVLLDPCRTWCPTSTCQAVCQLQDMGLQTPQLVRCKACDVEFCSACKASWHPGQGCPETMPISFLPGETSSAFKLEEDDAPIKRCPKCKVYIERDEGCAQMMCKNCKHAFCWYCLESLDDDFLLIHYDKGPCRNKLGHSRASVIWHRTQVVGIFAGFGLLLLVASPFLLLATPFVLCCKCKCSKGDDDPLPT